MSEMQTGLLDSRNPRHARDVSILVTEAQNLPRGTFGVFCELFSGKRKVGVTSSLRSSNPVWSYQQDVEMKFDEEKILVLLWCGSKKGNKFIGMVEIDVSTMTDNTFVEDRYVLTRFGKAVDKSIRLKISLRFSETVILSEDRYARIIKLLLDERCSLLVSLARRIPSVHVATVNFTQVASWMCRIAMARNKIYEFLATLLVEEIEETEDVSLLFRSDTIATTAFDQYLSLVGVEWLNCLQPVLSSIGQTTNFSCEVLQSQLTPESDLQKNVQYLKIMVSNVSHAIFQSFQFCPPNAQRLLALVRQTILKKFPSHVDAVYTGISALIFLRFFVPAIVKPNRHAMLDDRLCSDPNLVRSLTLVSLVLTKMSNLSKFLDRERHLDLLNPFIGENVGNFKKFIDALTEDPTKFHSQARQQIIKVDLCALLARLVEFVVAKIDRIRDKSDREDKSIDSFLSVIEAIYAEAHGHYFDTDKFRSKSTRRTRIGDDDLFQRPFPNKRSKSTPVPNLKMSEVKLSAGSPSGTAIPSISSSALAANSSVSSVSTTSIPTIPTSRTSPTSPTSPISPSSQVDDQSMEENGTFLRGYISPRRSPHLTPRAQFSAPNIMHRNLRAHAHRFTDPGTGMSARDDDIQGDSFYSFFRRSKQSFKPDTRGRSNSEGSAPAKSKIITRKPPSVPDIGYEEKGRRKSGSPLARRHGHIRNAQLSEPRLNPLMELCISGKLSNAQRKTFESYIALRPLQELSLLPDEMLRNVVSECPGPLPALAQADIFLAIIALRKKSDEKEHKRKVPSLPLPNLSKSPRRRTGMLDPTGPGTPMGSPPSLYAKPQPSPPRPLTSSPSSSSVSSNIPTNSNPSSHPGHVIFSSSYPITSPGHMINTPNHTTYFAGHLGHVDGGPPTSSGQGTILHAHPVGVHRSSPKSSYSFQPAQTASHAPLTFYHPTSPQSQQQFPPLQSQVLHGTSLAQSQPPYPPLQSPPHQPQPPYPPLQSQQQGYSPGRTPHQSQAQSFSPLQPTQQTQQQGYLANSLQSQAQSFSALQNPHHTQPYPSLQSQQQGYVGISQQAPQQGYALQSTHQTQQLYPPLQYRAHRRRSSSLTTPSVPLFPAIVQHSKLHSNSAYKRGAKSRDNLFRGSREDACREESSQEEHDAPIDDQALLWREEKDYWRVTATKETQASKQSLLLSRRNQRLQRGWIQSLSKDSSPTASPSPTPPAHSSPPLTRKKERTSPKIPIYKRKISNDKRKKDLELQEKRPEAESDTPWRRKPLPTPPGKSNDSDLESAKIKRVSIHEMGNELLPPETTPAATYGSINVFANTSTLKKEGTREGEEKEEDLPIASDSDSDTEMDVYEKLQIVSPKRKKGYVLKLTNTHPSTTDGKAKSPILKKKRRSYPGPPRHTTKNESSSPVMKRSKTAQDETAPLAIKRGDHL